MNSITYKKMIIILALCLGISACDNDAETGTQVNTTAPTATPEKKNSESKTASDVALPTPVKDIDPLVDELIKQASDHLSKAKSFSVHSKSTLDEVFPNGQMIQLAKNAKVLVRRPDRLQAEVVSDKGTSRLYYNGKTVSRFDLERNTYAVIEVPDTLDAALDYVMQRFQVNAPLADLLTSNPYDNYSENAMTGYYAGMHYLDGDNYHHLLLSNNNVDYQLWISTDDQAPLFRKFVITYKHLEGAPQYTANLTNWVFNPKAPDSAFDFQPPEKADKIDFRPISKSKGGA